MSASYKDNWETGQVEGSCPVYRSDTRYVTDHVDE